MYKNKNIIFTHFKIQYKKKIISFYKICINFPYLIEVFKILKNSYIIISSAISYLYPCKPSVVSPPKVVSPSLDMFFDFHSPIFQH